MQKSRTLQTDVDESRLHAGQDPCHFSKVDVAYQTAFEGAFDVQFLHGARFNHGDPRFLGRPIDENVLLHKGLCV